ncbi:T9SS type A sorting domain-containing protein [Bacteroidota bacterium]
MEIGNWKYDGNNSFVDGSGYLMYNTTSNTISAEMNWWGSSSGPSAGQLYGSIDYTPYLTSNPNGKISLDDQNNFLSKFLFPSELKSAMEAFYNGNYPTAANLYSNFIQDNPQNPFILVACKGFIRSLSRYQSEENIIEKISGILSHLSYDNDKSEVLTILAAYLERIGDYNSALKHLAEAQSLAVEDELKNRIKLQTAFLRINENIDVNTGMELLGSVLSNVNQQSYLHEIALSIAEIGGINPDNLPKDNAENVVATDITSKIKLGNYPNPFNPSTNILYTVDHKGNVKLSVYNSLGQEIQVLVNEIKPVGQYSVTFNASNLSSGVYFYRFVTDHFSNVRKMVVTK